MHVPPRFAKAVARHLTMNVLTPPGITVPLILAIHGRPGEGKTAMTRQVLTQMGALAIPVFADSFESVEAGEPAKELRRRYLRAAELNADIADGRTSHQLAVLMIDDLDQRIASDPSVRVQQTQNTPLLNAALMEIADSPELIDSSPAERTPIIVTANHLDWIYDPVIRTGRLAAFGWAPLTEERAEIVRGIFPELPEPEVGHLVEEFPDRAVSDFAAARQELFAGIVEEDLELIEPGRILSRARDAAWREQLRSPQVTLDGIVCALAKLQQDRVTA